MSRSFLFFAAVILAALALTFSSAAIVSRSASKSIKVEKIDLGNGKTRHRVRHPVKTKALGDTTTTHPTGTPDDQQAKNMIFVISNYCNMSKAMNIVSSSLLYAQWQTPPPMQIPSFFNPEGMMTGFEAVSDQTVDPNGQLFFNGTFTYQWPNGQQLEAAFGLVQGEWELETVSMTSWHLMIYASEYEDVAVYDIGLGDLHFTDKPIC